MAKKTCILCHKEYKYCSTCRKDAKQEIWRMLYDTENCKNISKALTDYNLGKIAKEEVRECLSQCDLTIELPENYRNEINSLMAKPRRASKPKVEVVEEQPVVVEEAPVVEEQPPVAEEAQEEPIEVVVIE